MTGSLDPWRECLNGAEAGSPELTCNQAAVKRALKWLESQG